MGLVEASGIFKKQDVSQKVNKEPVDNTEQDKTNESNKILKDSANKSNKKETKNTRKTQTKKVEKKEVAKPKQEIISDQKISSFIQKYKSETRELYRNEKEISLFDYKLYQPMSNNLFAFAYSCSRFEVFLRMQNKPVYEPKHRFPVFNYRIYFQYEYRFVAERLLYKKYDVLIKREKLLRVKEIPIILNKDTIYFVQDINDDLYTEYILRMMINEEYPDIPIETIKYYQPIKMESYSKNTVDDKQEFDNSIHESLVKYMNTQFSGSITKPYEETDMCKECIFKSNCEKHPGPLPLN